MNGSCMQNIANVFLTKTMNTQFQFDEDHDLENEMTETAAGVAEHNLS